MAISCKLNADVLRTTSCGYALQEITDIYLANFDDVSGTTIGTGTSGDVISGIALVNSASFYHIEPAKNSASFEDVLTVTDNGIKYRTATLNFTVANAYNDELHAILDELALGRYFAVVKLANGQYVGLGRVVPLEAETATLAGGSDSNGMTFALTANAAESPMTLTEGAIATVVGS